ncbi:MAG: TetR family transcriptional regulator [Neisseriaceae bacterium]|nr:TetR family transcriptional regulator [Neisseriaceae bacterium]
MRRTKSDSLQTRADLIVAALDLFDEQGVSKTTLAQVAAKAGVTRGAVYWHFKNKEDLFDAMCESVLSDFEQSMGNRMHTHNWDCFLDNILFSLNIVNENKQLQKFLRVISRKWESTPDNAGIYKIWEKHATLGEERLTCVLQNAQQNGKLAEHISVSEALHTIRAVHWGLIVSWITQQDFDLIKVSKIAFSGCLNVLSKAQ